MRTIDATLLTAQKSLSGHPCRQLVIGTSPNTIDISSYVLSYDYEEVPLEESSAHAVRLTITLDNSTGYFNTLTGDKAYITAGADVELKRGITVSGTDKVEELPTCYVETMLYDYVGGTSVFVLECLDAWGKLGHHRLSTAQSWSATSATTILEWILTQLSLTRLAGSMTALTLDFDIRLRETLAGALKRLARKMPEYLYPGLDKEIKWKDIDGGDSSDYTFGWNAEHPLLAVDGGTAAWEVNSVTVNGRGSATGNANDATEIAAVGTRLWTIYDQELDDNAECAQRAQAELDQFEADATLATLVCRPCHGLELYDVVTVSSPPWGGSNVVGRVVRFREEWNHDGRWHQVISLGAVPGRDPGNQPARRKRRKSRRSRRRKSRRQPVPGTLTDDYAIGEAPWNVPIGGIIMWSGAVASIPTGWALCDGGSGTPDLRDKFVIGAGSTYSPDDSGGAAEADLLHNHDPGTLATDSDSHTHGSGTLSTDGDSHKHTLSGATGSDGAHTHGAGTLGADSDAHTHNINQTQYGSSAGSTYFDTGGQAESDAHTHGVSGSTASDGAHTHGAGTLDMDNDSHSHDVDSGATGGDSHSHSVDSGLTGDALSATQSILPPYYALAFIMRIS